jgi:hypothetical protein
MMPCRACQTLFREPDHHFRFEFSIEIGEIWGRCARTRAKRVRCIKFINLQCSVDIIETITISHSITGYWTSQSFGQDTICHRPERLRSVQCRPFEEAHLHDDQFCRTNRIPGTHLSTKIVLSRTSCGWSLEDENAASADRSHCRMSGPAYTSHLTESYVRRESGGKRAHDCLYQD